MKKTISQGALVLISILFLNACKAQENKTESIKNSSNTVFNEYWYKGLAEINSFSLSQARYGELREGEAVIVFVTEDFLTEEQVKKEKKSNKNSIKVLKTNHLVKFPTGIYDYSMMTSTFNGIIQDNLVYPLKSTTSSQEWCGHSWMQLNKSKEVYSIKSYSYFENEGDKSLNMNKGILEDGLWNQIRLNPNLIDSGSQQIFPSAQYIRMSHIEPKLYQAIISKENYQKEDLPGNDLVQLKIEYPALKRTKIIIYEKNPPYIIAGWKEIRSSGFGNNAKTLTTTARRKAKILSPYWSKNGLQDSVLRKELLLKY